MTESPMNQYQQLKQRLNTVGFLGERRALALAAIGFYATIFTLFALIMRLQPETEALAPMMFGLGACYAVGFFAVGADWFWGRWFGIGLGNFGVTAALWTMVMARLFEPVLIIFMLTHAVMLLALSGESMSKLYEGREDWRKRFGLDEEAVRRLRSSVTRAASSLPGLIMVALKPKEDPASLAFEAATVVAIVGVIGMLRGRAWGVLAVAAAGVGTIAAGLCTSGTVSLHAAGGPDLFATSHVALLAGVVLLSAFAPFVRPVRKFLAARR
jgi:hypothetical protein